MSDKETLASIICKKEFEEIVAPLTKDLIFIDSDSFEATLFVLMLLLSLNCLYWICEQ